MAGTSIKLSTPPKLSAKVKFPTLLRKERLAHPWLIQKIMPLNPDICFAQFRDQDDSLVLDNTPLLPLDALLKILRFLSILGMRCHPDA